MFKGFYNLTSGMLTQGKNLNVIANNMTNLATAGYKSDCFTAQTFKDVLWSRTGSKNKEEYEELGNQSYITAPSKLYTNYNQGSFDDTGLPLDFAIEGDGFFAVQRDGSTAYTRSGGFSLDQEGYLCLPDQGRVLDAEGEPLLLVTDKLRMDDNGGLFTEEGGFLGQIGVYVFADNGQLQKNAQGLFESDAQPQATAAKVHNGMVERSNVELTDQMVKMIASQRAYQSAAQVTKMYDQIISQAVTDVGRL